MTNSEVHQRPLGVALLSVYIGTSGILIVITVVAMTVVIAARGLGLTYRAINSHAGVMRMLLLLAGVYGAANIWIAVGLWRMKERARIAALVLLVVVVPAGVASRFFLPSSDGLSTPALMTVFAQVALFTWYLGRKRTARALRNSRVGIVKFDAEQREFESE